MAEGSKKFNLYGFQWVDVAIAQPRFAVLEQRVLPILQAFRDGLDPTIFHLGYPVGWWAGQAVYWVQVCRIMKEGNATVTAAKSSWFPILSDGASVSTGIGDPLRFLTEITPVVPTELDPVVTARIRQLLSQVAPQPNA
jgi:hypothetical protein